MTLNRDSNVPIATSFRFLNVTGGHLEVNGLRFINADNAGANGGAIANTLNGQLNVVNCYFWNNMASRGGAIYNTGRLTVSGGAPGATSVFDHNAAITSGGAVHTESLLGVVAPPPMATIEDTYFTDNVAGDVINRIGTQFGGAIARERDGTLTLLRCDFTNNRARDGGAIVATGGNTATPSLTVSDSSFTNNSVQRVFLAPGRGGAVFIDDLNAIFTGCGFTGNTSADEGGAIYQVNGFLNIHTSTFSQNSALLGLNDVLNDVGGVNNPQTVFLHNTSASVIKK